MAYNEKLAMRIRERFASLTNVKEKKMMGGIIFMYNSKMCVGVLKDELMCRVDPAIHYTEVLKPGCRTANFNTHPLRGYIMVEESAIISDNDLEYWINLALDFNKNAKSYKKMLDKNNY